MFVNKEKNLSKFFCYQIQTLFQKDNPFQPEDIPREYEQLDIYHAELALDYSNRPPEWKRTLYCTEF